MTGAINHIFSVGSILIFAFALLSFLSTYVSALRGLNNFVTSKKVLVFTLMALGAMTGSLIYSAGIGYEPCNLCWWQRIFMYPIAVLGAVSLFGKKTLDLSYVWVLTILGTIFSLYHNFIYYTGYSPLPCSASASCTARYVFEYGFMTIPLMALLFFVSLILVLKTKNTAVTAEALAK